MTLRRSSLAPSRRGWFTVCAHPMIGHRINNYEVKSLLGKGGMGAVYLAEHPVIGRPAAIKVLHPMFASQADVVGRFFNEARAANAVGHPGIVDVIDVGTLPDGLPYLMMEFLRGESLAARLERLGRLPEDAAIQIGTQAASALAAAHAAGIVHRDLKPANLFLAVDREDPSRERLKILDFGIAKLSPAMAGDQVKTGTGAILGTPAYMSPEQSLGRQGAIDHRTDIYALGLILHHALAGAPPFLAEGFGEMVMLHMTAAPPPLRGLNPAVSPALEALILRALAKRPDDRFASMKEMGQALAGLGSGWSPAAAAPRSDPDHHAPTAVEASLPATIRLPGESEAPVVGRPPERALSTTLSSSALPVVGPRPTGARPRRAWLLGLGGGLVATAAIVIFGVTKPAVNGGGPTASPARSQPTSSPPPSEPPALPAAPATPPVEVAAQPAPPKAPIEAPAAEGAAPSPKVKLAPTEPKPRRPRRHATDDRPASPAGEPPAAAALPPAAPATALPRSSPTVDAGGSTAPGEAKKFKKW